MSTTNNELESTLLNKLVAENDDHQKVIKEREKLLKDNEPLIRALKLKLGVSSPTSKTSAYGSKVQMVQKIIEQLPKAQFTQNDIESEMSRTNPEAEINRDRIRAVIWSLAKKQKTIKLIRKGNNRQPAEFERLSNPTNGTKSIAEIAGLIPPRKSSGPPPRKVPQRPVPLAEYLEEGK